MKKILSLLLLTIISYSCCVPNQVTYTTSKVTENYQYKVNTLTTELFDYSEIEIYYTIRFNTSEYSGNDLLVDTEKLNKRFRYYMKNVSAEYKSNHLNNIDDLKAFQKEIRKKYNNYKQIKIDEFILYKLVFKK